jgi:hypothetical protein
MGRYRLATFEPPYGPPPLEVMWLCHGENGDQPAWLHQLLREVAESRREARRGGNAPKAANRRCRWGPPRLAFALLTLALPFEGGQVRGSYPRGRGEEAPRPRIT